MASAQVVEMSVADNMKGMHGFQAVYSSIG